MSGVHFDTPCRALNSHQCLVIHHFMVGDVVMFVFGLTKMFEQGGSHHMEVYWR